MSIFAGINAQGQSGTSAAQNMSYGTSSGFNQSWDNSFGYNYGYSNSSEDAYSSSWQDAQNWANSQASEDAWNRTYGREASAQDVENARAANDVEAQLWALQAAFNAKEAAKSREFQEYMSNTAYQRATKDLIKAGINPILAVGAMASTPVGATASAGLSSAHKANAYAESVGGSTYRSSSSSYGYSKGGSNSESHSRGSSYNYGENKSSGGSYGSNSSRNISYGYENSSFSNNVKDIASTAMGILADNERIKNLPTVKANDTANKANKSIQDNLKSAHNKALSGYHKSDTYGGSRNHAR